LHFRKLSLMDLFRWCPLLRFTVLLIGSAIFLLESKLFKLPIPEKWKAEKIKKPIYLAGTSEPSLLAYFSDKTLKWKDLPIKVCVLPRLPFRNSDYGKDVKGLYRVHSLWRLKIVICKNDIKESENFKTKCNLTQKKFSRAKTFYHVVQNLRDMDRKYRMYISKHGCQRK